jgi:hypothetical protein
VFCLQGTWLRFIEYSFSAAVMIVAISLQVGLMDAWMLFTLATLTWATMMLGWWANASSRLRKGSDAS